MEKESREKRREKGKEIRELRGRGSRKEKEERKFKEEKEKWRKSEQKPGKMTMNALLHIIGPGHWSPTLEMSINLFGLVFSHLWNE